jgi:hypothetical protein
MLLPHISAHLPFAFFTFRSTHVPLPTSERCIELSAEDVVVLPWMWRATPSMLRPAQQASLNISLATSHFTPFAFFTFRFTHVPLPTSHFRALH